MRFRARNRGVYSVVIGGPLRSGGKALGRHVCGAPAGPHRLFVTAAGRPHRAEYRAAAPVKGRFAATTWGQ